MATRTGRLALTFLAAALAAGAAERPQDLSAARMARQTESSSRYLMNLRPDLGLDSNYEFRVLGSHDDSIGQTHTRFNQLYQGVRVWGGDAITHADAEGKQLPITNALQRDIAISVLPAMADTEALAAVHADLMPKGPYAYEPAVELVIYPETARIRAPWARGKSLENLDALDVEKIVKRHLLAYHVTVVLENELDGVRRVEYLLNAHTGAIIKKWDALETADTQGTGKSFYNGTVSIRTNSTASGFEMRDMTRGTAGNATYDMHNTGNQSTGDPTIKGNLYTDPDNTWGNGQNYSGSGSTSDNGQTAAVDAHYALQMTWDMYKNVLGRNGIDGSGTATYNRVHFSANFVNAFWMDECFCMSYGDGDSFQAYQLTSLDVGGHEMSHGVCARTANLTYSGESGGLNESNSDIFGTMVEYYAKGAGGAGSTIPNTGGNFLIGDGVMRNGSPLRYMFKPSKDGQSPDAWSSTIGQKDVHYSSGPMNRAFYFMAQGATTTGDTSTTYLPSGMSGVGNDHAARIWFRTLTTYLTSSSDYAAARAGAINAAKDLYGAGSAEEQAVWNAFHGINVGAAWSGSSNTAPVIATQPQNATVQVGTSATFTVTASGASLAYQWRKNGANLSGATAASYTTPATTTADSGSTFSVVVSNPYGSVTSNNATLTVTNTPPPPPPGGTMNEKEPNNSRSSANPVPSTGTTVNGTCTSWDVDYFKVAVPAGHTLNAGMTVPFLADFDLYITSPTGGILARGENGFGEPENISWKNSGSTTATRYVKVVYYLNFGSDEAYQLKLDF